ncbi:MAG: class I SAM-dependent methyltransferase [bacterium]
MKLDSKVRFRRHLKYWFVRLKLHRVTSPFLGLLENFVYLSKYSKWCHSHFVLKFGDFRVPHPNPSKRYELFQFLLIQEQLQGEIDYLEFGVASGHSLSWWVENNKHPSSKFVGFDSFRGLPEDFGLLRKGAFSTASRPPQINDQRCRLVAGLFQDTLYDFLKVFSLDRRAVIHLDADLYSSTLFVLAALATKLKKDDILIFDEFGVPLHEFRAFLDFSTSFPVRYEVLGETNNYFQVAMKIL